MIVTKERTFSPFFEVEVDRGELERVIRDAFLAAFGADSVVSVYVSRFPHEYGAIVLLKHDPPPEAEEVALEQEERFRWLGIRLGILVLKAKASV